MPCFAPNDDGFHAGHLHAGGPARATADDDDGLGDQLPHSCEHGKDAGNDHKRERNRAKMVGFESIVEKAAVSYAKGCGREKHEGKGALCPAYGAGQKQPGE